MLSTELQQGSLRPEVLLPELQASRSQSSIDAAISINSGQTFLWERSGSDWYGIDGRRILKISVQDGVTSFSSSDGSCWEHDFFRLDDPIESVRAMLERDRLVYGLFEKYPGLRLIRQEPEQCLFSFLCASNTNILMIRRMLYDMTRKFGKKVEYDGKMFYSFPTSRSISRAPVHELVACGLGYRVKAIKQAADKLARGSIDLEEIKKMEYAAAKEQLREIYGIGEKIADCILLFSLEKLESFPIDVWIARSLARHYAWLNGCKFGEKLTLRQYRLLSDRMREHFGKYAGYAQQYLYYDIRSKSGARW